MSTAAIRVAVVVLGRPTIDEIASEKPKCCDGCGEEQIYGNAVAIHLGFAYQELCDGCFAALHDAAVLAARRGR